VAKLRELLASNVKTYRDELGISRDELAKRCKVSNATISNIENAKTWVGDDMCAKLARALSVEEVALFTDPKMVRQDHPLAECVRRVSAAALEKSGPGQAPVSVEPYGPPEKKSREELRAAFEKWLDRHAGPPAKTRKG
jgi:transcriptional regulator with XRE-family HTH domain